MARPPGPDTLQGHLAMLKYEAEARAYLRHLGFPGIAAFYSNRSRGTVSVPATPEDPELEWTHNFLTEELGRGSVRCQVLTRAYDPTLTTSHSRCRDLCNEKRFTRILREVLRDLTKYLRGCRRVFSGK